MNRLATKDIRKQLSAYGIVSSTENVNSFRQMLSYADTTEELKQLFREYMPQNMLTQTDAVEEYALEVLKYDATLVKNVKVKEKISKIGFVATAPIADRVYATVNTLSNWKPTQTRTGGVRTPTERFADAFDILTPETRLDRVEAIQHFEEALKKETQNMVQQKYSQMLHVNAVHLTEVSYLQTYVRAGACSWCCMIATGYAGKRRMKAYPTGFKAADRGNQRRVDANIQQFASQSLKVRTEIMANQHDNCTCILRPVFVSGETYTDEVSNKELATFTKLYDDIIGGETSSMDVKGSEGFLAKIREKRGY